MEIVQVKVAELEPSENNRAVETNGALKELANSLAQYGVLVPLIVREVKGKYRVVAGHRRLQAAKQIGMENVPCVVKAMDQDGEHRVRLIENLHRKDLEPIEEAEAFRQIFADGGHTAATLSQVIDKSERYIYRSLALLTLPGKAVEALRNRKITVGHAQQLLRVGPKQIEGLLAFALTKGYNGEWPTVADLRREIERKISRNLVDAVFPKDREYAGVLACTVCPYNTGNQGMLFDGAEKGQCTNGACFTVKTNAAYKELKEAAEKKYGLKVIGSVQDGWGADSVKGRPVVDEKKAAKALKENPERFALGIVKPSHCGDSKKPRVVLLGPAPKPGEPNPNAREAWTPEKQAEQTYKERFVSLAQRQALYQKAELGPKYFRGLLKDGLKSWKADKVLQWLGVAGCGLMKAVDDIDALSDKEAVKVGTWFVMDLAELVRDNVKDLSAWFKVDLMAISKKAQKSANAQWEKDKAAVLDQLKKDEEASHVKG